MINTQFIKHMKERYIHTILQNKHRMNIIHLVLPKKLKYFSTCISYVVMIQIKLFNIENLVIVLLVQLNYLIHIKNIYFLLDSCLEKSVICHSPVDLFDQKVKQRNVFLQ